MASTRLVASAVGRIPPDLPVDPRERATVLCQAVIGHFDAHLTWPLQQHACQHRTREAAVWAVAEGIRRNRVALQHLGLTDVDFATGNATVTELAEAMVNAQVGTGE